MMRMKTKTTGMLPVNGGSATVPVGGGGEWELRPGGMLVQKRNPDSDRGSVPAPTIRVRVKYGSFYHEINISSQATFGELKKMLTGPTGLNHQDQKLLFKNKERDSNAYLDISGVKDRSKIVLMEDPISQEKRFLEMRRNAKNEKASKSISEISLEVDKLGSQVTALESVILRGGKVAEMDVLNLIEMLMNQLIKLDGIIADGDAKLQRKLQVRRVQKYVETLDILKVKNSTPHGNGNADGGYILTKQQQQQEQQRFSTGQRLTQEQPSRNSTSAPVVVTTKWETFDSAPSSIPPPSTSASAPKLNWEFFE